MAKEYAMWVEEQPNGKFKFRQKYVDPLKSTPNHVVLKKVSITLTKNTKQAQNKARELLKEKIDEKISNATKEVKYITLHQLKIKFLDSYEKGVAYNTYKIKEAGLNRFEKYFGKDILPNNITTVMLNNYFNDLLYKGDNTVKNGTIIAYKVAVKLFYDYGVQFGFLKNNPVKDVKINFKNEKFEKLDRINNWYLTDEELEKIFLYCREHKRYDYEDLYRWLALMGMRIGEATSLYVTDIFQKNGKWYARVDGTMITYKHKHGEDRHKKENHGKTISSNRDVYMPDEAVKIYKRHCNHQGYLFQKEWRGNHSCFDTDQVNRYLKRICKKKEITKNISSHIFRHTLVSKMAELGYPLEIISQRVGHKDSRTTRQIYLHVTKDMKNNYEDKLKDFTV